MENFVQSIFDSIPKEDHHPVLVVSGDGRFWNNVAIQKIVSISAANGVDNVVVGQHGHLSTPAISNLIRQYNKDNKITCMGAILLTASHNPGGPTEDFGIKFNSLNGGPAPEHLTNQIYEKSKLIRKYYLLSALPEIDLGKI